MPYIFFTMNDFSKEGGATIRMYGILNELAKQGEDVTLISNAKGMGKFDSSITHINIGYTFSAKDKRLFQGVVGAFPLSIALSKYKRFINNLKTIIQEKAGGGRH